MMHTMEEAALIEACAKWYAAELDAGRKPYIIQSVQAVMNTPELWHKWKMSRAGWDDASRERVEFLVKIERRAADLREATNNRKDNHNVLHTTFTRRSR